MYIRHGTTAMASIAIMAVGAVLNAAAFTGGNYLAKYLSGDSSKAALEEKVRHDKTLEDYQAGTLISKPGKAGGWRSAGQLGPEPYLQLRRRGALCRSSSIDV